MSSDFTPDDLTEMTAATAGGMDRESVRLRLTGSTAADARDATGCWALVCGGREYRNRDWLYLVLDTLHSERQIVRLITGGARGADHLAEQWASERRVFNARYVADWKQHGRAAGPIRNQRMLSEEMPNVVVAFPGARGTADMVARAKAANVEVIEVQQ